MNEKVSNPDYISETGWRYFWFPVCTLEEFYAADPSGRGPLKVTLLGETLVIVELDEGVVALGERCCHRSASLALGSVDNGKLRCRYHGWAYNGKGRCVEIPACPDMEIPAVARIPQYETQTKYGLVWVRLNSSADTQIPLCPGYTNKNFKAVQIEPYTWQSSAARRLENYVDLAHFPYVHPNTLFDPNVMDVTPPYIDRVNGQLVFNFEAPEDMPVPDVALMGKTEYQITMPFTVNTEFLLNTKAGKGNRAILWMSASPIDSKSCRVFSFTCRDHDKDKPDHPHVAFQLQVLNEDKPVIESQYPQEIPGPSQEISVPSDKVSIHYRKWLRQLAAAAEKKGPSELIDCITSEIKDPTRKQLA